LQRTRRFFAVWYQRGRNLAGRAEQAMSTIRPEAIRADMRFLSDDLLEGRGTATRGHAIAAKFMAAQFEGLGCSRQATQELISRGAASVGETR